MQEAIIEKDIVGAVDLSDAVAQDLIALLKQNALDSQRMMLFQKNEI